MTDLHHANIVRYSTCWVEIDNEKSSRVCDDKAYRSQIEPLRITEESESKSSQLESQYTKSSCIGFEWDADDKNESNNKTVSKYEDSRKQGTFKDTPYNRKNAGASIKILSNVIFYSVFNTLTCLRV